MRLTGYDRPIVVAHPRWRLDAGYGVHWAYARPGGGPVLREEAVPSNISGLMINLPRLCVWVYYRRWKWARR